MTMRTCVTPQGKFRYGIHRHCFQVKNLRHKEHLMCLGKLPNGTRILNEVNFPQKDLDVQQCSDVYEIPNPFPFRGSTFIDSERADPRAEDPEKIKIQPAESVSMNRSLRFWAREQNIPAEAAAGLFKSLPAPMLLALATTSSDPEDLVQLAHISCEFVYHSASDEPSGLAYELDQNEKPVPVIHDHDLFEAVGNSAYLPEKYRQIMLLRPGVQGASEVVGDYEDSHSGTRVFEYLRRNSYIPWGHYASNMAHDFVRYRIRDLTMNDMHGLRHLYYQRTYVRLAAEMSITLPEAPFSEQKLEILRKKMLSHARTVKKELEFTSSLWGWNFGFDFTPTRYRLNGSHQQIHQQHAMIPSRVPVNVDDHGSEEYNSSFSAGDMIAETVQRYYEETGKDFFLDYIRCLRSNRRMDGRQSSESLIIHEDEHVVMFVPKAQVSQWEIQFMTLEQVGNILEANTQCRMSLDRAILLALKILEKLGAAMVTSVEFSKRFTETESPQRLIYSFLPKLPWSPGTMSEAQYRFICGCYPEDFAAACRIQLYNLSDLNAGEKRHASAKQ